MLKLTAADASPPPDVKRAKYRQLADSIRTKISDGYLTPGEHLPSEFAIAEQADVARSVVRQALDLLEREGVIEKRKGAPTKVADTMRVTPAGRVREISMARYAHQDALMAAGKRPDTSVFVTGHGIGWSEYTIDFDVSHELATPMDRVLLGLEEGCWVWRRTFVKYAAGVPVEIQRSALPEWVVDGNEFMIDPASHPYRGGAQWELYDGGHRARHVSQRVETQMPTENEERDLRIRQVAVLKIQRVFLDRYRRPVEASRLVLPGSTHVLVEEMSLGGLAIKRR